MIYARPELYAAQYQYYRDDLHFYRRLAEDYGAPVLELGTGTGRVSLALARAGVAVVGLELSLEMLEYAQGEVDSAKLNERVTLQQGDMRSFELERRFPLIIAPFNALMHLYTLSDQDAALACVRNHLAPGGAFAFDLYIPNFSGLDQLKRVPEWQHVSGAKSELFVYQTHDPIRQTITSHYYLDTVDDAGQLSRQTSTLTQRYYMRFELERALSMAGLKTVQLFGSFDREPLTLTATHLVVIARP
jgi:SAM-dependent methyltransferase